MNEIYESVFNTLTAGLTEPVLGFVPENYTIFPYVRVKALDLEENDTDTEEGFNAVLQVETYSRYRGQSEVSNLQRSVYNLLHRVALSDTISYGISTIQQESSTIIKESDGLTLVGVQRFTIIFEPKPA